MRISTESHLEQPLRVHTLAHDFELLDIWQFRRKLDASKGDSLALFVEAAERRTLGAMKGPGIVGMLFRLRETLGMWFGWDAPGRALPIPGSTETTLRSRLSPTEQAEQPWSTGEGRSLGEGMVSFDEVFRTEREVAFEVSNSTVHAILHYSLPEATASPRMAVYVKHRGWFGRAYMALINPFRQYVVYPALLN